MTEFPLTQILIAVASGGLIAILVIKKKRHQSRLRTAILSGARIVDVRSTAEFASGHYQGAINIPLDQLSQRLKSIGGTETPVLVYCASGMRSAVAAQSLRSAGYTHVTNAGGMSTLPTI